MASEAVEALDDLRRTNLEVAEAIAPGWERRRPFIEGTVAPVREWLARELRPEPGATVLELAAGAGDSGFDVAQILGDRGHLISSDFAPTMVEVGRRRGRERGVANVEHRVIDAERIDLGDDSVDGVLCRFGYMLMADPAAALAETRRVLRAGGRLAFAVWGPPDRNPFFTTIGMALVQRGHIPPPDPAAPGPFSLAAEDRIRSLVRGAGFESVRVEEVPARFAFASVDDYAGIVADTAGQIGLAVRRLGEDERAELTPQLEEALAPFTVEAGYEVPGLAVCAVCS